MKIREFIQSNIYFATILTIFITYQIYFPLYHGKNITLFGLLALFSFLFLIRIFPKILKYDNPIFFYFCFYFVICVSFLYTSDKIDGIKHLYYLFLAIPVYLFYRENKIDRIKILKIFLFSTLPVSIFTIIMYLLEPQKIAILKFPLLKLIMDPNGLSDLINLRVYTYNIIEKGRVGGIFLNAQVGTIFASINIFISLYLFLIKKKIKYLVILSLWLATLIPFASRSGFIALILTTFLMISLWLFRKYGIKKLWIGFASLVIIIFAVNFILSLNSRTNGWGTNVLSLSGRTLIWKASFEVIKRNPFFGVGLDSLSWEKKYNAYAKIFGAVENVPAHNMFLVIWAKAGILAMIFALAFILKNIYVFMIRYLVRNDIFSFAMFGIFVWFFTVSMVENLIFMDLIICGSLFMLLGLSEK